jgi:cobalt-zinc-cadmium efflux system outer membrane protein
VGDRPETQALDAERRAMQLRASAFRRSRVPNPTLSVFAQNDGFNERVLGLGVSLPIPIPGNVGRTYDGEVAEAEALAQRATAEREQVRREMRAKLAIAASAFESRRLEVAAFSAELRANAETSLNALGQEVATGRLSVRDAVIAQQALIDLLQNYVAARRAWCLASVELARAAGTPLERGTP